MKHRISPATVMSALALFFSLGGVGLAAQHYMIARKSQIAPWVRQALRGERGPRGYTGATGSAGTVDFSRIQRVTSAPVELSPTNLDAGTDVTCPTGLEMLSGGYTSFGVIVSDSFPKEPNEWAVSARLQRDASGNYLPSGYFTVWAFCVPA